MAAWIPYNRRVLLLNLPKRDRSRLPVRQNETPASFSDRARRFFRSITDRSEDMQIVAEFRNKLRTAEDLIAKLAYNLREIQGMREEEPSSRRQAVRRRAVVSHAFTTLVALKKD